MMPDTPTHLHCALCPAEWEVSEEDADATLSDCWGHVSARHFGADPYKTIREGKAKP